ncbi:phosphonate degradation operons associated HDIG domain protein [Catalinimonas alkaloidigena]|uniref:Phosphonate degradation operons associated HDIG domain protein n=1 Tax=Catalinimonas alkaloidigena TaxID=1075417 RepID=A0A1G9NGX2_9BACT|nr:phosphonate degradation HD-domain oxygenase [Catalinimonas alkaloidigena]SDL85806.1 phosphonate degradation operons associated HDIG domain protein [Catalinimonas alkaloidigena]
MNPELLIDKIFTLYELHGHDDYIGEPVSQLEHMAQAAQLAEREGFDEEVILAAFFHDIGHLCASSSAAQMDGYGVVSHEKIGADFLRAHGFSERVARLVEGHVQAKRYLTYKYPDYYNRLSEASQQTLRFQGGRMSPDEAEQFEVSPLFGVSLRMRHWDEEAKEEHLPVPDLKRYKKMAQRHLEQQGFVFSDTVL